MLEEEHIDAQLARPKGLEDPVCVVGAVVAADPRVVAPDDEVRAAVVLAQDRVEHRLARPRVAHREREHRQQRAIGREVLLEQHLVAAHPHRRRHVVALGLAHERVEQEAVDRLEGGLDEVLVRAVHGVARLEAHDPAPAALVEQTPRLDGIAVVRGERALDAAAREPHPPGHSQILRSLVQVGDPRVRPIARAVDVVGLRLAIEGEDLVDHQAAHHPDALGRQRHLLPRAKLPALLVRDPERDRDRERQARRQPQITHDGRVVSPADEALEGAERAGRQQLEIRPRPLVERQRDQRACPGEQVAGGLFGEHALHQRAAMRGDRTGKSGGVCHHLASLEEGRSIC